MKKIVNQKILDTYTLKPISMRLEPDEPPVDLDVIVGLRVFTNSTYRLGGGGLGGGESVPIGDVHSAIRVLEACRRASRSKKQPALIKLEDSDHTWLTGALEKKGPNILGLVADPILRAVKGETLKYEDDPDDDDEEKTSPVLAAGSDTAPKG
jgi:hypothetical protein